MDERLPSEKQMEDIVRGIEEALDGMVQAYDEDSLEDFISSLQDLHAAIEDASWICRVELDI